MDVPTFNVAALLGGSFVIGLVAACWSKIKLVAWRVSSLMFVRTVCKDDLASKMQSYVWTNGKRTPFGMREYDANDVYVKPVGRRIFVAEEQVGHDSMLFWIGWRPLLIGYTEAGPSSNTRTELRLTFLRWTFDPDTIVQVAVDSYNDLMRSTTHKRYQVQRYIGSAVRARRTAGKDSGPSDRAVSTGPRGEYTQYMRGTRLLTWKPDDIGYPAPIDPLGLLAYPPEVDTLVVDIRRWKESEGWYKERQIPWRFGVLAYGKPGTGKTSLARAIAQDLDIPVFALDLAGCDDTEFTEWVKSALSATPCMILLEDFDTIFKLRENRLGKAGGGLNFGTVLNSIDGIENSDGLLLFVTTNHLEDLDPAMGVPDTDQRSTRPGRIHRAVELTNLTEDCRRRIAERILSDYPADAATAVAAGDGETGAQFVDRCTRVALAHFWALPDQKDPPAAGNIDEDHTRA